VFGTLVMMRAAIQRELFVLMDASFNGTAQITLIDVFSPTKSLGPPPNFSLGFIICPVPSYSLEVVPHLFLIISNKILSLSAGNCFIFKVDGPIFVGH
jgi:hypothetical protein